MPLDPSIILQGKPVQFEDPTALRMRGLQLQNAQMQNDQARKEVGDQRTLADLYKRNLSDDGSVNSQAMVGGMAQAGLGAKIPAYQKSLADSQKAQTESQTAQFDIHKKKLDYVNGVLSSLIQKPDLQQNDLITSINQMVNNGVIDANQGAQMARQIPGRPEQLRPFLIQKGLETMDASKRLEMMTPQYNEQDRGDVINQGTVNKLTGQRTPGVDIQKTMTPDQSAKVKMQSSGGLSDNAKEFMVERLLSGDKPGVVLSNLGRGAQGAQDLRAIQNLLADTAKARGIDARGIINAMQGTAADARTMTELGSREGKIAPRAQELDTFADQALAASAKVPRGNWKGLSEVLQWGADQSSDPELGRLQVAVDGVINARAAAIGGGVIHVGDQITGHKLLSAARSPEDFAARIDQFKKEAQGALESPEKVRERMQSSQRRSEQQSADVPPDIAALLQKHGAK